MASRRTNEPNHKQTRRPPATTPEGRENQLVALAVELAEKQLIDGTATSQVISHYLKLGSSRERLEQERLMRENELIQAKIEGMASAQQVEELYTTALNAMRVYSGQEPKEIRSDYDDD